MSLSIISRSRSLLALAVILTLTPLAEATSSDRDRFELFSDCQPIYLIAGDLTPAAVEIGLTKEAVRAAVESRLRSAQLYNPGASTPFLYVYVHVVGIAFHIDLEYNKQLLDPASGLTSRATTWSTGTTGTHGRDVSFILAAVSELMDLFLVEFVRVNEEAC